MKPKTVLMLVMLCAAGSQWSGCASIDSSLREAAVPESEKRFEAFLELEDHIRALEPGDSEGRAAIAEFLAQRIQPDVEPEIMLRDQALSLACQGQFANVPELLAQGAEDPEWQVRLTAVKGMAEYPESSYRPILTRILENDTNLLVRVEAAKVFRHVGDADWADPLIQVLIDESEDPSVRYQAYLSAKDLTGSDLPYVPDTWRQSYEKD